MKKTLLIALMLVVGIHSIQAQQKSKSTSPASKSINATVKSPALSIPEKVTSAEGITEYRLGNGLKVLLFPDPSKQTITVNITYLVGSRHEGYGETGMSHLLEHMVFKGTKEKHKDVAKEITDHGADFNGTTWLDRTNYYETFAATDENLEWALDMEADRMVNSRISKSELETEMTVVRNEFEMGENDPSSVLNDRIISSAFLWHNYGNSTIGARSDIEKVPIENLQAYYKKYYQPDNAVLLVAGKFDPVKTLNIINQKFGVIPRPERVLPKTFTAEPTQDGERQVTLRRVGDVQAVGLAYHIPSGLHPDYVACDIFTDLLTDAPSGRLYKALIDTKKAASQYGYSFQLKEPGVVYFGAEVPKEKSADSVRTLMIETIEQFAKTPPTPADVERIKVKNLKNIELLLNNAQRVGVGLSEYIAQGDWRLLFHTRNLIEKVTVEDIQRVAKNYFKSSNRTSGIFYPTEKPDRAEIPEAKEAEDILKDFKGRAAVAEGEAFDPSPSNIDSRTKKETIGLVKVALLPKKTRGSSVFARMTLRFGDEKSLLGTAVAADLAADMLTKGTTKHTRQQFQDELDKLKARVSITGGPTQANVSIETTRENLVPALKLVAEALKTPVFPADEFEKLKQLNLTQIESQKSDPQAKAIEVLNQVRTGHYAKNDVRYNPTLAEQTASYSAAKLDEAISFYKNFYGASAATFSAVGDFDENEVKELIKTEFSTWKSPKPFTRIPDVLNEAKPVNVSIETPDKANAFFVAYQPIKISDTDPDYPALELSNYILGGSPGLANRLMERIRQKEGLSYGVGSNFSAHPIDKSGSFLTYAIYAPENLAKLEAAFKEEIEKVLKDGFTQKEIDEAKKSWLQGRQVTRSQDNALSNALNSNLYLNRSFKFSEELEKKVSALTSDQILQATRKTLDLMKMSLIKAGDYEGAAKKKAAKSENTPNNTGAVGGAPK
ncbi:M16 family metallopeptidase [Aquirufa rosea]|uniref:Insulinase family protein n=1 Tax=Aquirufa rosea TaxID=2509241 RepID=A0A4Q1C2R6_9BACT|nr:pitrilysin family protein [Aquirufa rosea]RXK52486.1 insulinase family protein [Aquirufa rosea]